LLPLADVDRMDAIGEPRLLKKDRDFVAVGRRPIVEINHRKYPTSEAGHLLPPGRAFNCRLRAADPRDAPALTRSGLWRPGRLCTQTAEEIAMNVHESQTSSVAEAYLQALRANGVKYVFANGGTDFAPIIESIVRLTGESAAIPQFMTVPHENVAM